ncbi:unnamed protein product [Chrysodeixis includens]|uniref:unspecific monooxygenase n=1 Tax=Chrysodeixis includens TaxID=689277 RepID=A0A9N8L536_CHRIL|nr:unnamed protein product [Chrysodeixis includens]
MWVLFLLLFVIFILYQISKYKFDYWEKKKVPYIKPAPLLGNYGDFILLKTFIGDVVSKICAKFPNEPYIGAFYGTEPTLIVQDPELIKLILAKDFYYFHGREVTKYTDREPLTKNIFFTHGDSWKVIRQNMTPLYTTAKMKNMFHLIEKCSRVFESLLEEDSVTNDSMEVNCLMCRFTMDCIGSCAFGVETNGMQKEYTLNPYMIMGSQVFARSTLRGIKNISRAIWPYIFYKLGLQIYPESITDFFIDLMSKIFKQRDFKPSPRHDFVDFLLNLYKDEYITGESIMTAKTGEAQKVTMKVDYDLLAGQCISFLGAGYETSATTMSMTLFELAQDEELQARVIKEVDEFMDKHDNVLDYSIVTELPFLEACIDESLRLYPPLTNLTREVMESYTFPSGLNVDKGVRVHIPVYHIHRNPNYYPNPEKYDPERFLPEEKKNITPFTYLPFGEGQRLCIGLRFAKMQMIAGLVTIFKSYKIKLADGMPEALEFDPRVLIHVPKGDVNIKFIPRKDGRSYNKTS